MSVERNRRISFARFRAETRAHSAESHRRHARGINHSPHPSLRAACKNRPCPINIRPVHLLGIPHPEPVIRRHMKHHIASGHSFLNRCGIAQISDHSVSLQLFDVPGSLPARTSKRSSAPCSASTQGHMAAHKSRRTCDENFHAKLSAVSYRAMSANARH